TLLESVLKGMGTCGYMWVYPPWVWYPQSWVWVFGGYGWGSDLWYPWVYPRHSLVTDDWDDVRTTVQCEGPTRPSTRRVGRFKFNVMITHNCYIIYDPGETLQSKVSFGEAALRDKHDELAHESDSVSDGKANKTTAFIAEVRKDKPLVTKRELWGYYRSGPYSYTQTLFQNIATAAGYDHVSGPGSSCLADTASGQCVLPWMGSTKSVSSIILVANGVSFAIMTVLFTSILSAGDYGTFGRWLLFVVTVICWASQYASPDQWKLAMVLYIIGHVRAPALIRYTPGAQFALNLALLIPPKTANDPKVQNYTVAMDNSYWVLLGIWWCTRLVLDSSFAVIFQLPRPGPPLPKGEHYRTIGWKQLFARTTSSLLVTDSDDGMVRIWEGGEEGGRPLWCLKSAQIWAALKTYKPMPYPFVCIVAPFLFADGVNATDTLVGGVDFAPALGYHRHLNEQVEAASSAVLRALTDDDGRAQSSRVRQHFFGLFGLYNRASSTVGLNVIQVRDDVCWRDTDMSQTPRGNCSTLRRDPGSGSSVTKLPQRVRTAILGNRAKFTLVDSGFR
ncbi:hypothetical protein BU15DRAFT_67945, partial [Melanogaster broomeanus]